MTDQDEPRRIVTPAGIVLGIAALLTGGLALGYNPLFATSAIALVLSLFTLRAARPVSNDVVQGVLRIFAITGIMGAAGGVMVILYPTLGVRV